MQIDLSEDKILEIAEKEIEKHVRKVMTALSSATRASSEGYDIRFEKVVERVTEKIIKEKYLEIIEKTIKDIIPTKLAKLITEELDEILGKY